MKVKYENSMQYRVLQAIQSLPSGVVLRQDIVVLGSPRQISRALKALVDKNLLVKIGYGVYAKLIQSTVTGDAYIKDGFLAAAREALTKLGMRWEISQAEEDYNVGKTQQVPINPATKLRSRFRRTLTYQGRTLRFE